MILETRFLTMKIPDLISAMQTYIANEYVESINDEAPKNLDKMTELFNNLTELAIHMLKTNQEFRLKFAQIHAEYLKYPESRQVIEESINAYNKYNNEKTV